MADAPALDIERSLVGTLELEGANATYVNLERLATIPTRLRVADVEYAYDRSFPIQGHSAVLPETLAELEDGGKRVVVAERAERYILFVA